MRARCWAMKEGVNAVASHSGQGQGKAPQQVASWKDGDGSGLEGRGLLEKEVS
jgi:hypothetical protein